MKAKIKQYLTNLNSGMLESNTMQILNYIKHNPECTLLNMRLNTFIQHQTLTSAISNLMDEGIIYITGQSIIDNKHYSRFKFESDPAEIIKNRQRRERERIESWIKKGLKYNIPADLKNALETYKNELNKANQLEMF